jgi:integrase
LPRKRKNEVMNGQYFTWKLWRRGPVYQADGRSNPVNAGRHSLDTTDRSEAQAALRQLDLAMAVKLGMADKKLLLEANVQTLDLDKGRSLYMASVAAPEVTGGVSDTTQKRYRAIFDKFIPYAQGRGVNGWGQVNRGLLHGYAAWLEEQKYADRTIYMEVTTIKQVVKFLVDEGHLPEACRIVLPMTKPSDTPTYCYTEQEVQAIVAYCKEHEELAWLGNVFVGLACTGMRIGELASLRWADVDVEQNNIRLTNDPSGRRWPAKRRRTKSRRDRSFPIHPDFQQVLNALPRHSDGRVFHGPLGGLLKADTVRNILIDRVLPPVAATMKKNGTNGDVTRGRLHSFRHYFCSHCSNNNVPMQMVMDWLGQRDSAMVRYYYHLSDPVAQAAMKRLSFVSGSPVPQAKEASQAEAPVAPASDTDSGLPDRPGQMQ